MQQTQTYKLNKPDADDPVAIAPLNENMDKVEGALVDLAANHAGLDARVTAIEIHKIAIGSYYGQELDGKPVDLGFTPKFVLVGGADDYICGIITERFPCHYNRSRLCGEIRENGFMVCGDRPLCGNGYRYTYIAFA